MKRAKIRKQTNIWLRGLDGAPYRKQPKLNNPDVLPLDNPKQILTNLIEEKEAEAKEERYYVDGRHRDRWWKHNAYMGRLEYKSYSKRWWGTKKLVFVTNKHAPTSHAVVVKTLKTSQHIAAECEEQCILVAYDLAIAKMTY